MKLKVKIMNWSAGLPVAILNQKTAEKIGVHLRDRITIKTRNDELTTIIDTAGNLVNKEEIAVSSEIKNILNLKKGQKVDINLAAPPESLEFIKLKLNKQKLTKQQIFDIIRDLVDNELSEAEIALFVSVMYKQGMSFKETIYLIEAILETGQTLKFKQDLVVDKHSIGGIPGNRTTPIIVSICAAAGLTFPKTSSRAITSAAGTADVMETIAHVDFNMKQIKKIIKKTNACLVWGGGLGMVPADSKIIKIEKELKLDPEAQLLASIMAKKLSVGSNYILIDIPYGRTAKVSKQKAKKLKKKFEKIGKAFHKKLEVVLTPAKEPMGEGVGPVLELMDVIKVLDPREKGPIDLEKKSLMMAGRLLEMTKKAKKGGGEVMAKEILISGKAFKKFKSIVKAQKGNPRKIKKLKPGRYSKIIYSGKRGIIKDIDNKKVNSLARSVGCPADKFAGLKIHVSLFERVKKKQKLITIYAESPLRLKEAIKHYKKDSPISIKHK